MTPHAGKVLPTTPTPSKHGRRIHWEGWTDLLARAAGKRQTGIGMDSK